MSELRRRAWGGIKHMQRRYPLPTKQAYRRGWIFYSRQPSWAGAVRGIVFVFRRVAED